MQNYDASVDERRPKDRRPLFVRVGVGVLRVSVYVLTCLS